NGTLGQFFTFTYKVTVTSGQLNLRLVDNGGSNPNWAMDALDVVPVPVATILGAPASGHSPEGTPLTLQAGASDPGYTTGFQYAWSVYYNGNLYTSGAGPTLAFRPGDNGSYTVNLSVTDPAGIQSAPVASTIVVDNVPPTVTIAGSFAGLAGKPVAMNV